MLKQNKQNYSQPFIFANRVDSLLKNIDHYHQQQEWQQQFGNQLMDKDNSCYQQPLVTRDNAIGQILQNHKYNDNLASRKCYGEVLSRKNGSSHQHKVRNKTQFSKSAQQLLMLKSPVKNNKKAENRFSAVLGSKENSSKYYKLEENLIEYKNQNYQNRTKEGKQREVLGSRASIDNINIVSTIQMLKRQVEMLDAQEYLGIVHKFSTLEQRQQEIQENSNHIPQKNILLQVTKFRKQNLRKVAKGRPELYNWVRNYKKQIAQLQPDYKTQVLKKSSQPKKVESKQCRKLNSAKQMHNQNQKQKQKQKSNQLIGNKARRLTFVERLKKLQSQKYKQKANEKQKFHSHQVPCRRIHSEQQQDQIPNLRPNLRTLL